MILQQQLYRLQTVRQKQLWPNLSVGRYPHQRIEGARRHWAFAGQAQYGGDVCGIDSLIRLPPVASRFTRTRQIGSLCIINFPGQLSQPLIARCRPPGVNDPGSIARQIRVARFRRSRRVKSNRQHCAEYEPSE